MAAGRSCLVLTRPNRLTSSRLFSHAVRRGRRAGTRALVVHLDADDSLTQPQVGFVVGRAVGPAVTRNLVKRRLRHLSRERLDSLPGSAVLVVRALPSSAGASYSDLAADLDRALVRVLRRSGGPHDRRTDRIGAGTRTVTS